MSSKPAGHEDTAVYQNISKALVTLSKKFPAPKGIFYKTGKGDYAEHDQFIGVAVPLLRKVAQEFRDIRINTLKLLITSKINEERLLALFILIDRYKRSVQEQKLVYQFYLDNIGQINNWNLVDASAHLILGRHLYDKNKQLLITFAKSQVMWERRIAIVATWHFIKMGEFEWTVKLAEELLNDECDLIHKSVGWMLREVGKKDIVVLEKFLQQFLKKMPRTMLRYAIEKFPETERKLYLKGDLPR